MSWQDACCLASWHAREDSGTSSYGTGPITSIAEAAGSSSPATFGTMKQEYGAPNVTPCPCLSPHILLQSHELLEIMTGVDLIQSVQPEKPSTAASKAAYAPFVCRQPRYRIAHLILSNSTCSFSFKGPDTACGGIEHSFLALERSSVLGVGMGWLLQNCCPKYA